MRMRIIKKKIRNPFNDTTSHKNDVMTFGLYRDHPPASMLKVAKNLSL